MKLRIRGNAVRIRVSQTEMSEIATAGFAQDSAEFGPHSRLTYRVEVVPDGPVSASFESDCVSVRLPRTAVERWQRPDEVSLAAEQPLGDGRSLKILVEKDFACLAPRSREEGDDDLFPNPAEPAS